MFSSESEKITALLPDDSLIFTSYATLSNNILNWATSVNKIFDLIFNLESNEMTALWPNYSFIFTFYVKFSNSIINWTTFVKEIFWFDA